MKRCDGHGTDRTEGALFVEGIGCGLIGAEKNAKSFRRTSLCPALGSRLSTLGKDSTRQASAREFLATLPDRPPACLILDLQMPEMRGLDLLHHFKRNGIRIPTIVVTAQADGPLRALCEASGIVAFLPKPVEDMALFAAIEAARSGVAPPTS